MTIKRNILANYIGTSVLTLAPIIALPWYLNSLGAEQFGLVAFIIMLQAVLSLLDAGMSQALMREISVRLGLKVDGQKKTAELLVGFERLYWLFAVFMALCTVLLSSSISQYWLNLGGLPVSLGEQAVVGAAILFAVQFPGSVYRSVMISAQAQVSLNVIMSAAALLRHLGAVVLLFQWPDLLVYLIWHCLIGLLETLVRSHFAWRCISVRRKEVKWSSSVFKATWVFVAGMSAATWLGALTVQMDKIILSRMISIDQFGYYIIAASLSAGALQMIYPLVQAFLPQAIQLRMDLNASRTLNVKLCKFIGLIVVLVGLVFTLAGEWLLNFWLGNIEAAAAILPVLTILLIGSALNAFYNVGYVYWIAHEKVRRILQVNALALVLSISLIPMLVNWYGVKGAAFGWVIINLIGFLMSLEWLKIVKKIKLVK